MLTYASPVVLHSDHCAHKLLPWFDGMLDADEKYFKEHGEPLYSYVAPILAVCTANMR